MPDTQLSGSTSTESRVAKLEVSVESLHDEVGAVRSEVREGTRTMMAALNQLRDDATRKSQTNWSQVFAGGAIIIAVIGAIGTSWIAPLEVKDNLFQSRLIRLEDNDRNLLEYSIRNDERIKILERRYKWAEALP